MLHLPAEMDRQLWQDIQETEGETVMAYITSIERIGIEKGVQQGLHQGLRQGLQEGLQQGLQQGESRLLRKQLERRFGALPTWASDKLNSATEQDLEAWGEAVLTAPSLDAVFDNGATH
jgi:flagellar biosynthesis/type III secretory pathway protein FliH